MHRDLWIGVLGGSIDSVVSVLRALLVACEAASTHPAPFIVRASVGGEKVDTGRRDKCSQANRQTLKCSTN
jgi:hypothetical protein